MKYNTKLRSEVPHGTENVETVRVPETEP